MIVAFESIKRAGEILKEIEALQNELSGLFGGSAVTTAASAPKRRGRPPGSGVGKKRTHKMSEEGRAKIAAAAKARWAKVRAEKAKAAKK